MTDSNPSLQQAVLEIVDNQLRAGEPPQTRATFNRLVAAGYADRAAKKLIAAAIVVEVFDIMKHGQAFDRARFIRNLDRLPELPLAEDG
jgi:hypothetical protein